MLETDTTGSSLYTGLYHLRLRVTFRCGPIGRSVSTTGWTEGFCHESSVYTQPSVQVSGMLTWNGKTYLGLSLMNSTAHRYLLSILPKVRMPNRSRELEPPHYRPLPCALMAWRRHLAQGASTWMYLHTPLPMELFRLTSGTYFPRPQAL
jgi:hypothetical protein